MKKKRPLLAGNWKMHKTATQARDYCQVFLPAVANMTAIDIALFPSFLALPTLVDCCKNTTIAIGGQNLHQDLMGAFTGEISANMLQDAGATMVLIGHSERRQFFYETDGLINKKLKTALTNNLQPILCIGETKEERQNGDARNVVEQQLVVALSGTNQVELSNLIIAYEPVWAIGTGVNASANDAQTMHSFIREVLSRFCADSASISILYGGSVKQENALQLVAEDDVDGLLVGSASLDPAGFANIAMLIQQDRIN